VLRSDVHARPCSAARLLRSPGVTVVRRRRPGGSARGGALASGPARRREARPREARHTRRRFDGCHLHLFGDPPLAQWRVAPTSTRCSVLRSDDPPFAPAPARLLACSSIRVHGGSAKKARRERPWRRGGALAFGHARRCEARPREALA
jgi:hypothetical protein